MAIDQTIRRAGLAVAAITVVAGSLLFFAPGVADSLPVSLAVAQLAALVALGLGMWVVRSRYNAPAVHTSIPDVEYPLSTPTAGHDIDRMIYRMETLGEGQVEYRQQVRDRLIEISIAVLMRQRDCSRDQAIEQLEQGSWTDNTVAAGFFTGASAGTGPSLLDQLTSPFSDTESAYRRQLRETIAEIEELGMFEFRDEPSDADDEQDVPGGISTDEIITDDEGERVSDTVRYRSLLTTRHWYGISAFTLVALAVGTLSAQPALILAGALGIGIAGYTKVGATPPLTTLDVTRELEEENPQPGTEVEVTVTVENTGNSFMPDLKLIDRVPPMMRVTDGSPRLGTALRPGSKATFSYTVVAERGVHSWPLEVVGRDASGSRERDALVDVEATMNCVPRLQTTAEMPVRLQTSVYAGELDTKTGGEGLEFHSIRDYQPGDPKRRIDWKSYAKSGEFSTIDFREEHAARVVLLFDGREASYASPRPGEKHAVEQSVDVASDIFASLNDQGHLIGIAAFNGVPCWLAPNTGSLHRQRVRNLFTEHPAIAPLPPDVRESDVGRYVDPMVHIRRQLPENTQIFLFSPLTDSYTYEVARRLNGAGHLVTVVSPDPTAGRTLGQRLARLERKMLIKQLRDHGIRVVDWSDTRSLNVELEHARRRWEA